MLQQFKTDMVLQLFLTSFVRFSKQEAEYAFVDLMFLGITNLLLLRGDTNKLNGEQIKMDSHDHATDLQEQVNNFNKGIALDGSRFTPPEEPFSYGMACYPEKHAESPNMDSEIFYTKMKVDNGAEYLVTQMFFDNRKYFDFVDRCRAEGILVPIIPGIKPVHLKNQLTVLPKVFGTNIPEDLAKELRKCKNDEDAKEVGIEWCIAQCKELIQHNVPSIHFILYGNRQCLPSCENLLIVFRKIGRRSSIFLDKFGRANVFQRYYWVTGYKKHRICTKRICSSCPFVLWARGSW